MTPANPKFYFMPQPNFPNPFSQLTTFSFSMRKSGGIRLRIYDLRGRLVMQLFDRHFDGDAHNIQWRPERSLPSDIYFYTMQSGDVVKTGKIVWLK